jgi:hypothetical protein
LNEKIRLREIVNLISRVSDLNFQRNVWLEQKQNDIAFSMGELINLLDDYSFFEDVDILCSYINDKKDKLLIQQFEKELLNYQEPENIVTIFYDEQWLSIVNQANKIVSILTALNF